MKRTSTRLADGRELIYFDEDGASGYGGACAVRHGVDTRDLPERSSHTELRYDPLRSEWVAIASHRQSRTHLPPSDECPLCPTTSDRHTEVPSPDYDVVVFENRFPSFATGVPDPGPVPGSGNPETTETREPPEIHEELVPRRPGVGRCEVVCFTAEHDTSFASLSPGRVRTVVDAWADRTAELGKIPDVEEVFCFENRGEEIGVTLHHPHGQIYAYPFVTPRSRATLDAARTHRDRTGQDLFADILSFEHSAQMRIVRRSTYWTAFVPAAARWPVEVHFYPHRKVADIPGLSGEERDDFATVYLDVLRRLDNLFDAPLPYVAAWHQAPVRAGRELAHLRLEIFSIRRASNKLKYLAGSESGMGVFINDVAPEDVARRLREAGPSS